MVRQRQAHGKGAVLVLCAVSVLALAGCSGHAAGSGPAPGPHATPVPAAADTDAVALVHRAAEVLTDARSARTRTSMQMAAGGTRVTINGEGVYDFRRALGQLDVLLPPGPAGHAQDGPILELLSPAALYMKNRGAGVPDDKWVRVRSASAADGNLVTGGATDPLTTVRLLRGADTVTYRGTAELDGVQVQRFSGTADLRRAARALPARQGAPLLAAAKGFSSTAVPFDVWLDAEGRVRLVRHRFSYDAGRAEPVAVTSTTRLNDFGVAADSVQLPAGEDIWAGYVAG